MPDLSDPQVLASIALVLATVVLAAFTGLLWRTNRRLAELEKGRLKLDQGKVETEARRRRYARVAWKVELAERILAADEKDFLPTVVKVAGERQGTYRGRAKWTTEEARWLRQFARLVDPEDGLSTAPLEEVLDAMDHRSSIDEDNMQAKFFAPLHALRDAIAQRPKGGGEIPLRRWRADMDRLAAGEEVPPALRKD